MRSCSAIITNHNYARFLPQCLESAEMHCGEILIYDDGSTDESMELLERWGHPVTRREEASGGPVWGSNLGIQDASCDYLIFLDADNFLIGPPPLNDVDYTFAAIQLTREDSSPRSMWRYPDWPLTAQGCMDHYLASTRGDPARVVMPFPWGGVWRTDFVRSLRWRYWPSTKMAADYQTAIDWCQHQPTLAYDPEPFLAFRTHSAQWSASPDRSLMQADAVALAETLQGSALCRP